MYKQRGKLGKKSAILTKINQLRERQRFRNALRGILETEDGKYFFEVFLKHCHVTRSQFSNDPYKIVEEESLRRLAMSYLKLLGQDNTDYILAQLESETRAKQEQ